MDVLDSDFSGLSFPELLSFQDPKIFVPEPVSESLNTPVCTPVEPASPIPAVTTLEESVDLSLPSAVRNGTCSDGSVGLSPSAEFSFSPSRPFFYFKNQCFLAKITVNVATQTDFS